MDENEEVNQVVFLLHINKTITQYQIGFRHENQECFPMLFNSFEPIGAYHCLYKIDSDLIYRIKSKTTSEENVEYKAFFIRRLNWVNLFKNASQQIRESFTFKITRRHFEIGKIMKVQNMKFVDNFKKYKNEACTATEKHAQLRKGSVMVRTNEIKDLTLSHYKKSLSVR